MAKFIDIVDIKAAAFAGFTMIGALIGQAWGNASHIVQALIVAQIIDYITGFIVAAFYKNSNKTDGGGLNSGIGLLGLLKKGIVLSIVYLSMMIDTALGWNLAQSGVALGFLCNEIVSITENCGLMGIAMPKAVLNVIEVLSQKSTTDTAPQLQDQENKK